MALAHEELIPAAFVTGTCFRLEALEAEHTSKLTTLRSEFLRDAAGATSAGSVKAALDATGGWSSDQHFRFGINLKVPTGIYTCHCVSYFSLAPERGHLRSVLFCVTDCKWAFFFKNFSQHHDSSPSAPISKDVPTQPN